MKQCCEHPRGHLGAFTLALVVTSLGLGWGCSPVIVGERPLDDPDSQPSGGTGGGVQTDGSQSGGTQSGGSSGSSSSAGVEAGASSSGGAAGGLHPTLPELPMCGAAFGVGSSVTTLERWSDARHFSGRYASVDVNGDGLLDWLVLTSTGTKAFLQKEDASFSSPVESDVPGGRLFVTPGSDFNHDGALDFIVTPSEAEPYPLGIVLVAWGDGTGHFQSGGQYATGTYPIDVEIVDLDGDEVLDLGVTDYVDSTLTVLLGKIDGTFVQKSTQAVAQSPDILVSGRLNADDFLDLALVSSARSTVQIFKGHGDGQFEEVGELPGGGAFADGQAADLDGDDVADLVFASGCELVSGGSLRVLSGLGEGKFDAPMTYSTAGCPNRVMIGDFDGDTILDLMGASGPLLGQGDGTFGEEQVSVSYGDIWEVADWDRDGVLDATVLLATREDLDDQVYVKRGNGDGSFGSDVLSELGISDWGTVRLLDDVNDDGLLDALLLADDSVVIALGAGDGTFALEGQYPTAESPGDLIAVDLNGDGLLDLATANWNSPSVTLLLAQGDDSYARQDFVLPGDAPRSLAAADVDGDGKTDLIVSQFEIRVLRGNGDGTFALGARYPEVTADPLLLFDLDGDGALDLPVTGPAGPSIMFGRGDGTFSLVERTTAQSVEAIADFDEDGKLDMLTSLLNTVTYTSTSIQVARGRGDGSFEPDSFMFPVDPDARQDIFVGDWDGDGHLDVAADDVLARGRGDGTFSCLERRSLSVGRFGDVNGDGLLDYVAADMLDSLHLRSSIRGKP